jgi:type I restriction enzyme, S subunit
MFLESDDLPDGWHWISIGDVATVGTGATPLKKNEDYYFNGQIPWVTSGNLNTDFITNTDEKITELAVKETNAKIFPLHTLLVAMYGEGQTRGRVSELLIEAATNQACAAIILEGCAFNLKPYIKLFFVRNYTEIRKKSSGGVQPNLNLGIIKATKIPLPPLNEQRRIVSTIEQLTDRSHKARTALEDVPKLIAQFRQSVLAAAFRGDLTADWREKNPDIEPASELLERIKIDRNNTGKISKNKSETISENIHLSEIPASWKWIAFGELVKSIRSGSTSVPQDEISDYPILRSSSVRSGMLDLKDIRYLSKEESKNQDVFLDEGDLLFTRLSGSVDYVANCAVVRNIGNQEIQYPDRIFRAKLIDYGNPDFCEWWFSTKFLRSLITKDAKSSAGHQRISMGAITQAPIPLPPLAEQKEIVAQINSLFSTIKFANQLYVDSIENFSQLDRSILAKAFRGELVPQDPNDEPAAVLLERIRAEREQTSSNKQRGKTTRKNSSKQLSIERIE